MADETEMPEGQSEGDSDERESTLVPSSLFGGDCKVGDTYTVKVVGKYDDELAIEHVPHKKEEKTSDTMEGADDAIEMMADKEQGY